MKERYDSEKNLKNAFDNFEMPFDPTAFDKFSAELDKEEKRKRFIWWIFFGKFVAPVLLIGTIGFVYFSQDVKLDVGADFSQIQKINKPENLDESTVEVVAEKPEKSENSDNSDNSDNSELRNSENKSNALAFLPEEENSKSYTTITQENLASGNDRFARQEESALDENTYDSTPSTSVVTTSGLQEISTDNSSIEQLKDNTLTAENQSEETTSDKGKAVKGISERYQDGLSLLDLLDTKPLERIVETPTLKYPSKIEPYKAKFKRYFYFNLGLGVTIEDNQGVYDQFFTFKSPNELLFRALAGYQVNEHTALEFSYISKNLSLGYDLRNYNFSEKVGSRVNILKLGSVHRLKTFGRGSNLYFTTGVSMIVASQDFNLGADFGKTIAGQDVPNTINNVNVEWEGLYSKNHFMYSSGFRLDTPLSEKIDLLFGAEYTFGVKSIMRLNLSYIEGEGIIRNTETSTNSSFASFTIGLKYRMGGD